MAKREALKHIDSIRLSTRHGDCEIQLLDGDISLLPLEEKVDIVIVSAFPNTYAPVASSTIGALKRNQNIDVQQLSQHKEVDLRRLYSCWISQHLPRSKSFRKLVCFEKSQKSTDVVEQIGLVFRAFMPIFNGQETTVITPLLATGSQRKDKVRVLQVMVQAAAYWIKAGLPLRCLKIVNYVKDVSGPAPENEDLVTLFTTLKQKWNSSVDRIPASISYDVYFIFNTADDSWVKSLSDTFKKVKSDIRIFTRKIPFNPEEVWQKKIFKTMIASKRIVAVLTPGFAEDTECLEQFNMALCCCRQQPSLRLLPFYLIALDALPSYLALVQYVDCRLRKEGEDQKAKMLAACTSLVEGLDAAPVEEESTTAPKLNPGTTNVYDVFISYSHRQPQAAEHLLQHLTDANPSIRIFFDRSELTSGSLWQQTLYEAADQCRCMILLINPAYLKSSVCRDEYNIAIARALTKKDFAFLPVCSLAMESMLRSFGAIPLLDAREKTNAVLEKVASAVTSWLNTGEDTDNIFPTIKGGNRDIEAITATYRKTVWKSKSSTEVKDEPVSSKKYKIVFSFSQHSLKYAVLLHSLLGTQLPHAECLFLREHEDNRLHLMDTADLIVFFVCSEFTKSPKLLEELHVALCRQRASPGRDVVYLIKAQKLPSRPVYLNLLPYRTGVVDEVWMDAAETVGKKLATVNVRFKRDDMEGTYSCHHAHMLALRQAASHISETLSAGSSCYGESNIVNIVAMDLMIKEEEDGEVPLKQGFLRAAPSVSPTQDHSKVALAPNAIQSSGATEAAKPREVSDKSSGDTSKEPSSGTSIGNSQAKTTAATRKDSSQANEPKKSSSCLLL